MSITGKIVRESDNIVLLVITDEKGDELGSVLVESRRGGILVDVFRDEETLLESVEVPT